MVQSIAQSSGKLVVPASSVMKPDRAGMYLSMILLYHMQRDKSREIAMLYDNMLMFLRITT